MSEKKESIKIKEFEWYEVETKVREIMVDLLQPFNKKQTEESIKINEIKRNMATIGKNHAVAEIAGLRFGGWFAWVLWGLVHIMFLVGFRARVVVMWNWLWNFLFYSKGARLITGAPSPRVKRMHPDRREASGDDPRDLPAGRTRPS